MKLSAYTDVCLRVLMTLAAAEGERLTSQQIADRIQVPYNHVIKAVAELRRRGTIEVLRGRHGGAMIAAAGLVAWTGSAWPDLAVAGLIALLFLHSAYEIVTGARRELGER